MTAPLPAATALPATSTSAPSRYDDHVAALLAAGDAAGLAALDVGLGSELLATGRLTWPVAAAALRPETAELTWRDDPFGLSYFVALWR